MIDQDLKDIGSLLGHQRIMLAAIAQPELGARIGLATGSAVVDAAGEIYGDVANIDCLLSLGHATSECRCRICVDDPLDSEGERQEAAITGSWSIEFNSHG
jgi:hypothetical protein